MSVIAELDATELKRKILALADTRLRLETRFQSFGVQNMPLDPEEALKARIEMRLLADAIQKARNEYNTAIAHLTAEQMEAILS